MKKLSFLLVLLLVVGVGSVNAFPLWPGVGTAPGTRLEDDDLEFFEDKDGDNVISVGDVLYAALEFPQIIHKDAPFETYNTDTAGDELVAWLTIELKQITDLDLPEERWWFGEHDDGDAGTDDSIVKFYSGGALNFDSATDPTFAQAKTAVEDGSFLWSFSVTADTDTFYVFAPDALAISAGIAVNNPEAVRALSDSTTVGSINYALNQTGGDDIFSSIQLDFQKLFLASQNPLVMGPGDGLTDMTGSGAIQGGNGRTNAFSTSDAQVDLNPVPEPATLTLFGFSLLGMVAVIRRRSNIS